MVQEVDVLIVGSGSAGLCAATYLARCGIKSYKILERRPGPMAMGQADGVQCRTVEVYESFGLAEDLKKEAYHVLELTFWSSEDGPEVEGRKAIQRKGRAADTMPGLSHQPHVILNQARMNKMLIGAMRRSGGSEVEYGWEVEGVEVDRTVAGDHLSRPVTVKAERSGQKETFKAKYVLGCDGAHSIVRKSLGFQMIGDSTEAVWGVMDVYPHTDFPDIRKKAVLRSDAGTLMIIPREGGSLARFYIELPEGTSAKEVKLEDLKKSARDIFHPYKMEIAETAWWSAYAIGQRLANHFSESDRVFLTGDACHTHSPKAGQGMNVSLQDGYNVGWKLAQVLKGQADPHLITTYVSERAKVAADLIDFDRWWTKTLFSKSKANGPTAQTISDAFIKSGKYTAGLTATYDDSCITSVANSKQNLAKNLAVGMRFPSTQVVRLCDAKAMHLVQALPADGRWRIVIFAGDIKDATSADRLNKLADYLSSERGPVRTFTPKTADIDSFIEPIVVVSSRRVELEQEEVHPYFWPATGKWQMRDLHKVLVDDESYNSGHGHAYDFYGVDTEGAVAIVRPDQYVSMIVGIDDHEQIGDFFTGFALSPKSAEGNGTNGLY